MSIKGQFLRRGAACKGEPGKPLSPLWRTAPPFAPTQLFELRRCCAWLIKIREHTVLSYLKRSCFRFAARTLRVTSHRNAPSGHSGVAHGLFYDSAPTHLRCAGVPLGLFGKPKRSSFSRFAASIKPHYALFSKTHMLQVRCANPTGTGEPGQPLRRCAPAPPFAPKRPFGTFRCCAWLFFRKEHTMLFSPKRSCFRFAALTLRVSSHRPSSLSCAGVAHGLFYDSAPTHLRCAGVPLGLFGKPKRSSFSRFAASIKPHRALLFKTHMLQVRCAHPTGTGEPRQPFGRRC